MKAVTVCQPYAHLIALGEKRVENRTWPTRYRGPVLIHAGKSRAWLCGDKPSPDMAFGALVAVAQLVDCIDVRHIRAGGDCCDKYPWIYGHAHTEGPWCWVLADVRPFDLPLPWKGALSLFDVPDHVLPPFAVPANAQVHRKNGHE